MSFIPFARSYSAVYNTLLVFVVLGCAPRPAAAQPLPPVPRQTNVVAASEIRDLVDQGIIVARRINVLVENNWAILQKKMEEIAWPENSVSDAANSVQHVANLSLRLRAVSQERAQDIDEISHEVIALR